MKLLDRMTTLLKADAHGVMDQLEERSLLLKQHLREAELELDRKRARLDAVDDELRRVGEAIEREEAQLSALDNDVELALGAGKDDLARFCLKKLLPRRARLEELRERRVELGRTRQRGGEILQEQEARFDQLRRRVRARLAEEARGSGFPDAVGESVSDEEIELELMRRRAAGGSPFGDATRQPSGDATQKAPIGGSSRQAPGSEGV